VKRWAIVLAILVIVVGVAGAAGLPLAEVRLADALKSRLEQEGTAKVAVARERERHPDLTAPRAM